jgi:ABC-type dipeptide/oligopeptide/nickel transport system ATPase component
VTALSAEQPYPGLRPFDLGDEAFFFGREAQTRALREKLKVSRLIAVVGRSGCGKSSLVRAGLVPQLLQERGSDDTPSWRIATFRPQGRPMRELADALLRLKAEMRLGPSDGDNAEMQALRASRMEAMLRRNSLGLVDAARELKLDAAAGLLIIVDQFEEIFRFEGVRGSDADEATAFVRLLLAAVHAASPRVYVMLTMRLDFLGDCARFQGLPEALS